MFRFFKKKRNENRFLAMLAFDDSTYAEIVSEVFESMDSATRAHVLVAYENLLPILSALWAEGQKQGEEFTIERFIRLCAESADEARGVATFAELLSACRELGVKFMVCEMGLRATGLEAGQLRDDIPFEQGGIVSFLADASPSGHTVFI